MASHYDLTIKFVKTIQDGEIKTFLCENVGHVFEPTSFLGCVLPHPIPSHPMSTDSEPLQKHPLSPDECEAHEETEETEVHDAPVASPRVQQHIRRFSRSRSPRRATKSTAERLRSPRRSRREPISPVRRFRERERSRERTRSTRPRERAPPIDTARVRPTTTTPASSSSSSSSSSSPLSFARGRLLVLTFHDARTQHRQESEWKEVLRRQDYMLYDNLYPFRMAAQAVMRQNKQYRQPSRFRNMSKEPYTEFLYEQTSRYFGPNFETNYFVDWAENLPSRDRQPIVVFGLRGHSGRRTEGTETLLTQLRRMGAMVLSPPGAGGDYIMHSTRDLENFVKDFPRL